MRLRNAKLWIGVLAVAVASAVAGSTPAGAAASGDEGPDVEAARAGLEALTAGMEPVGEFEPLTECPVVDRDAVIDALETAGIDSPVATLDRVGGPALGHGAAVGVVCSGAYVGSEEDETFPETLVTVTVADVAESDDIAAVFGHEQPGLDGAASLPTPTLGGATLGACRDVDRHTQCLEYWQQDGFVIGVQIDDRVHVDRPTASAVLVALVPEVVATLVAVPEYEVPAQFEASEAQVAAARAGLAVLAGQSAQDECPLVDQQFVDAAARAVGLDVRVDEWRAADDTDDDAVACRGSGRDRVTVLVEDHGDSASAEEVISLVHGCDSGFCVESWQQDGLLVTLVVTTDPDAVDRDAVAGLLEALVPVVLGHLADAA